MRVLAIVALALMLGCSPAYPGEVDGTFDMVGSLDQNTCGDTALPAANPLLFRIELRSDGTGQAFWRRPETPVVAGTQIDGTYRFRFVTGLPIYAADEVAGTPGCALLQEEVVELVPEVSRDLDGGLDGGDAAADDAGLAADAGDATIGDAGSAADAGDGGAATIQSLHGSDTIRLTVAPGYDCTPLLGSAGGPFLALPCQVDYSLSGSPGAAF